MRFLISSEAAVMKTELSSTRRRFLAGTAGALAHFSLAQAATSQAPEPGPRQDGAFPVKAVSSANGLQATQKAYGLLRHGADPLDAVVAGVNLVEDDPEDMSVGLGGLPNEEGIVELDAAVMHGPTHRAGAVAALQGIRNPSKVAQLVMERTDHVLLVGEGALRFARAMGFEEQNLLTERARKAWLRWKQNLSPDDDWLSTDEDAPDSKMAKVLNRPSGTIHCAGINAAGEMACTTTTSGLAFKIPGRVGDSPILGAGLYVDNEVGSCGSTGRGEANLRNLCCFAAVEIMRGGMSPEDAGLEVLRRVVKTCQPRLRDEQGRPRFGLSFYLLAKDSTHAGVTMWGPHRFAVTDDQGTRHEECAFLYERERE